LSNNASFPQVQVSSVTAPPAVPATRRCLFGGAGAIAPLIVLAISVEWSTVFGKLTWFVILGYCVKAILLFVVGAFVAFLQKSETDDFKCFICGISAPALITTYAASNVHAGDLPQLQRIIDNTRIESTFEAFQENPIAQFQRGFSGSNPLMTVAVVGQTSDRQLAIRDAASVELFVDCSIQGKLRTPARISTDVEDERMLRKRGLSSDTIVVYSENDPTRFFVVMKLGPPDVAYDYLNVIRPFIDVSHIAVINQARAPQMLDSALQQSDIGILQPSLSTTLQAEIQPDCVWKNNQF
jgi:hypothetical protein